MGLFSRRSHPAPIPDSCYVELERRGRVGNRRARYGGGNPGPSRRWHPYAYPRRRSAKRKGRNERGEYIRPYRGL